MTRFNPPAESAASAAAQFVLNELLKVAAYSALPDEDRGSIALAVARISEKFYSDGCLLARRNADLDYRGAWFKGCWLGPQPAMQWSTQ